MSGRLGEFLSPSLRGDPWPFAPQIFRSTGPLLVESKMVSIGVMAHWKRRKGGPLFSVMFMCDSLNRNLFRSKSDTYFSCCLLVANTINYRFYMLCYLTKIRHIPPTFFKKKKTNGNVSCSCLIFFPKSTSKWNHQLSFRSKAFINVISQIYWYLLAFITFFLQKCQQIHHSRVQLKIDFNIYTSEK